MKKMVKIWIELEVDEEGYPLVNTESVWAHPCGEGVYEIDNIPFFAKCISCGDKVFAELDVSGELKYRSHQSYSGHSTVRLIFFDIEKVSHAREALKQMGCASELSHIPGLVSIDIPPDKFEHAIVFIKDGEKNGFWDYEEGTVPG